ncbi:MAG: hypothetical protein R3C03_01320 [Pirellulaceae bacterium]
MTETAQEAASQAREALANQDNILRTIKRLRKTYSPQQAAMIIELVQLQNKAKVKFSLADQMLLTRVGYEQATSERLAKYKASCFPTAGVIADICTGIGGDAIALAQGRHLIGIESQQNLTAFARHNLRVYQRSEFDIRNEMFSPGAVDSAEMIHIDPDRRSVGRTIRPEDFSPSLSEVIKSLGSRVAAIKLAPASGVPHDLRKIAHREWLGESREAKQQVLWFNHDQKANDFSTATVVRRDGSFESLTFANDETFGTVSIAKEIGSFILEPHAALLAGKLNRAAARWFRLNRVGPGVAYLTGDELCETSLMSQFAVVEVVPLHLERVADTIKKRKFGKIEWKKRAVEQQTFEQLAKIKGKGDEPITAIVTPTAAQAVVVFCRRILRSP